MHISCFKRPGKPLTCKSMDFNIIAPVVNVTAPKLLTVHRDTECHVTPDQVADLMVSYLEYKKTNINTAPNRVLEPSAGTGQLVSALLRSGVSGSSINTIEKDYQLSECLARRFERTYVNTNRGDFITDYKDFEYNPKTDYSGYDRIICNPPFKTVISHIDQVYKCLNLEGIAVCLVPVTYKKIEHEVLETLPNDTFSNCTVNTKIIKICK